MSADSVRGVRGLVPGQGFSDRSLGAEKGQVWDAPGGGRTGQLHFYRSGLSPGQIIFAAGNGILFLESAPVPKGRAYPLRTFPHLRAGLPKRKTVLECLHVCLFSGL